MPPKAKRSAGGQKRDPATPAAKISTWSDPDPTTSASTPPMAQQAAANTPWSSSSNSLVGKADLNDRGLVEDLDWRTYIRYLPSNDDLKDMLSDIKDTVKSEIASMRQDFKDMATRIEMVQDDMREFTI